MQTRPRRWLLLASWLCWLAACSGEPGDAAQSAEQKALPPDAELASEAARAHPSFDAYWQRGLAEVSRYSLQQSRYGEVHQGEAVLIFVTEPFDTVRQVKHEGKASGENVAPVLKLNATRRFYTGVYPYTVMTSSFVPLTAGETLPLKLTFSAQEWCGQVFTQLNRRGDTFEVQGFSYFEAEGDVKETLGATWSEDGLWALLRRDPQELPVGELWMIPALHHLRLRHQPLEAQRVVASVVTGEAGERKYTLQYASGRRVEVRFEAEFPHGILGFTDAPGGDLPATEATRTQALMLPYWEKNKLADGVYREALGLTE